MDGRGRDGHPGLLDDRRGGVEAEVLGAERHLTRRDEHVAIAPVAARIEVADVAADDLVHRVTVVDREL